MKRFITYLYDYMGAVKGKNAGFVKVDMRANQCRLEIHVRGLGQVTEQGVIYLIIEDSGLNRVKIGEMEIRRGQGDYGTIIKCNPIGDTPYQFGQIAGVCVTYGADQMAASKWKEDPNLQFALQDIHIWEPPQLEPEAEQQPSPIQPVPEAEAEQPRQAEPAPEAEAEQQPRQAEPAPEAETEQQPRQAEPAPELEAERQPRQTEPVPQPSAQALLQETGWTQAWMQLQKQNEKLEFRKEKGGDWIKIDVKAIRSLPKRNWYLGNNSFLLHGFFNYHYLILGRERDGEKERWYLGVPGYYQQQERVMATIFGFPEFFNSQNGAEPFGYWIHTVEME